MICFCFNYDEHVVYLIRASAGKGYLHSNLLNCERSLSPWQTCCNFLKGSDSFISIKLFIIYWLMEMICRNRCFGALGFVIFINKLLLYVLKKGSAAENFVVLLTWFRIRLIIDNKLTTLYPTRNLKSSPTNKGFPTNLCWCVLVYWRRTFFDFIKAMSD